jgi:hypothetical protein
MTTDPRCCGSGTCIIDTEGRCWCGQRWDGERLCHETPVTPEAMDGTADEPPLNATAVRDE